MELWIRSQDKTTLIRSYEMYIAEHSNSYVIRAKRTSHILGAYKTIERALEVLDEIQRKIEKLYALENCSLQKNSCIEKSLVIDHFNIYEMPEK